MPLGEIGSNFNALERRCGEDRWRAASLKGDWPMTAPGLEFDPSKARQESRGIAREEEMRFTARAFVAAAALAMMAAPAQAQAWKTYVSRDLQFSFSAPGEVKVERGVYKGERSGDHPAVIFRSVVDGIEYKATVVDFNSQVGDAASLLEEAVVTFMGTRKTLMDNYGRVNNLYGRKVTVDTPNNGGRSMASFYFNKGYLYRMQATVRPANGDYASPDAARFIDSQVWLLRNNLFEAHPFPPHDFPDLKDAIDLTLPN